MNGSEKILCKKRPGENLGNFSLKKRIRENPLAASENEALLIISFAPVNPSLYGAGNEPLGLLW